jgi:hypothetical protein
MKTTAYSRSEVAEGQELARAVQHTEHAGHTAYTAHSKSVEAAAAAAAAAADLSRPPQADTSLVGTRRHLPVNVHNSHILRLPTACPGTTPGVMHHSRLVPVPPWLCPNHFLTGRLALLFVLPAVS